MFVCCVCVLFMTKCRSPFLSAAYFSAHTYALLLFVCVRVLRCVCMTCMCACLYLCVCMFARMRAYVCRCVSCMCVCVVYEFSHSITIYHIHCCVFVFALFTLFFFLYSNLHITPWRRRLLSTILHAAYLVYGWYIFCIFLSFGFFRGTGSKLLYAYL